ncbi:hypothetical protein MF672_036885 [Actinomadura sp. ATCC 31491]|uniref:Serine/threonine protein kinase n=1 Tax=Actinomadura luzonensis TaxID=2805427 RepID=A0ABT0G405_9ACTN|nr:hypothetical protein [Actinomadura luzonensis]MCK2219332.1 hypothetical protein [Actinomadura luzonensis]
MANVASPLQYGDPPRLGPFVVQARLHQAPAGFVYLGQASDGRAVSLAVLTRGAAFDAAARERFVTAIREAGGERAGRRGWFGRTGRQRGTAAGAVLDGAPEVLDSDLGNAPWVAVPYVPGRPGAEWFLEPVMVGGTLIGQAHGPDFVPYWLTDRAPALPGPVRRRLPLTETRRRVLLAALALALLLALVAAILLLLVFGRNDSEPQPRQLPPTVFVPTAPPTPETTEPRPSPSQSSSPTQTGPATPGTSPGDDGGEGGPL